MVAMVRLRRRKRTAGVNQLLTEDQIEGTSIAAVSPNIMMMAEIERTEGRLEQRNCWERTTVLFTVSLNGIFFFFFSFLKFLVPYLIFLLMFRCMGQNRFKSCWDGSIDRD